MAISDRIAVMDHGVIVQEGSAEALSHRPASAFGAQGKPLLKFNTGGVSSRGTGLAATIVSRTFLGDKVEYQVRVGGQTLQVTDYGAGGSRAFAPGEAVTLEVPSTGVWILEGGT